MDSHHPFSALRKGVVLVDKPAGMTSFDVVERTCKLLGARRGGHAGTLDPAVTGLMLVALEEARKAMPVLMGMDKEYEGRMLLHGDVDGKTVGEAFRKFTGEIMQKPPVKSRVARVERKRNVYSLAIRRITGREVEFSVSCEAGTYIRKLVHDIGQHIGCGAHMIRLRRTGIGPFRIEEAVPLTELSEKDVIPLENILKKTGLKKIVVEDDAICRIRNGVAIGAESILESDGPADDEIIGIFDSGHSIIALARFSAEKIKIERVFLP